MLTGITASKKCCVLQHCLESKPDLAIKFLAAVDERSTAGKSVWQHSVTPSQSPHFPFYGCDGNRTSPLPDAPLLPSFKSSVSSRDSARSRQLDAIGAWGLGL